MMRNKTYASINILGLAIGVAGCLLLALYIQDEVSFDRHQVELENLYRLTTIMIKSEGNFEMKASSAPIVWGIKKEVPEIKSVTRVVNPPGVSRNLIRYEDKQFIESDGFIADSTLFDIFTYDFKAGNPKNALVQANPFVITEQLARKLFRNEPPLDKTIFYQSESLPA
jgi:putative ABC transport system permease protein